MNDTELLTLIVELQGKFGRMFELVTKRIEQLQKEVDALKRPEP